MGGPHEVVEEVRLGAGLAAEVVVVVLSDQPVLERPRPPLARVLAHRHCPGRKTAVFGC